MKSYTITVNGTAYEVTVEETGSVSAPAAAPKAAPKAAPAAAPKAAAPAAGADVSNSICIKRYPKELCGQRLRKMLRHKNVYI